MAQGKLKTKVQLPAGTRGKQKHHKKSGVLKKGCMSIAPKKARHVQAAKLKKSLEKEIKKGIEQEVAVAAGNVEPKRFNVVNTKTAASSSKK
ncbi:leydig cell tumor 10 kDa protein homolog isoform X2 [Lingula anatina]|uniref:Leydig cell tumor 10 kDa protein homolog isoform X1 n=1 Tax=Lingula anatina TaxID=7574 RepID=A0A1S3JMF8_LINAN|nr:leydig cell tumor 10 kDa protein homolog isoform X1 [Lingula anatina]XP_023932300.1 leydig cell tumor 10 kDa protein homolog isoform X2 [Lingula anatina]|eukprot:XP_013411316.1 leydig cell tumor 10 kDa protein homolog isoform X1 [Lingula anatina]